MIEYFLGSRQIASSPPIESAHSLAYFCPRCGDVWARIWTGASWDIEVVPCEKHTPVGVQDWSRWPGSLLSPFLSKNFVGRHSWPATLEHIPLAVLEREFHLALAQIGVDDER